MDCYRTNILQSKDKLGTGCIEVDRCLQGGISTREICEISGESSSGKTQLCLQLLVNTVCLSHGQAIYFHTEGDPPLCRLQQIAKHVIKESQESGNAVERVLDHVYIEHSFDGEEDLYHRIVSMESLLIRFADSEAPVKVFIVDSIAYMFRDLDLQTMSSALSNRSGFFFRIASLLRKYADVYNLAVIVTNHAVDLFEKDQEEHPSAFIESFPGCAGLQLESSARLLYPALGLSWSNCITTRLFTSKEAVKAGSGGVNPVVYTGSVSDRKHIATGKSHTYPQVRGMQIVFSPDLPQHKCHFIIGEGGCYGISHSTLEDSTVILNQTRV